LDDDLAAVLEPKAPAPSKRLAMLREASKTGIPVYVAVAPFMPFHSVAVLDVVMEAVIPLNPSEIFCEVLNPKGDAIEMVATALAKRYPSEAASVRAYDQAAWARWTYQVLAEGVSKYGPSGFIAWPDTGRAWARHLTPTETAFLDRFLPVPATTTQKENLGQTNLPSNLTKGVAMARDNTTPSS